MSWQRGQFYGYRSSVSRCPLLTRTSVPSQTCRLLLDKLAVARHNIAMKEREQASQPAARFVRAYAKINLTLDILGRRSDGYHDLATIMQTIDLFDTICLGAARDQHIHFYCTRAELNTAENLIVRAARLVQERFAVAQGVSIEVIKRIPAAAGLGGGSSDAAATILALRDWWQLESGQEELLAIAAELGSDVPFFLKGGLALCEGRGERITELPSYWPDAMRWLLLLKPAIGVSTASVFRRLPASDYTDGAHTQAVRTALREQSLPEARHLHNGLERSVLETYPEVALAREDFQRTGAELVKLSGSGPTLFATFAHLEQASHTQQQLQAQGYEVYLTQAINGSAP